MPRMTFRFVAVLLASLALPQTASAERSVLLFPALGRPTLVTVTGRALKSAPEQAGGPLAKSVRRLTARSWEGASVTVRFQGQERQVVSGDEGLFEASFPAPSHAAFPLGALPVAATAREGKEEASVEGKAQVISDAAPFLVLSDFDDTVAVTNVRSKRGMVSSALLKDEDSQPVVEGMADLYRCLREGAETPPGFAFVSGSPIEYAPRLERFLSKHGFPAAALHLRQLGPGTLSGYKEPVLRALLSRFPQPVVLVGDSGEKDPEVYATIRHEFPGRVLAVFIRDAGGSADAARLEGMVLFKTPVEAARAAAGKGLLKDTCQIGPAAPPAPAPQNPPPGDRLE